MSSNENIQKSKLGEAGRVTLKESFNTIVLGSSCVTGPMVYLDSVQLGRLVAILWNATATY
jgi:hypothetical protein